MNVSFDVAQASVRRGHGRLSECPRARQRALGLPDDVLARAALRAQAVSGVSCRAVAERLALPERLRAAAPAGVQDSAAALVETERVLASVIEAVIGACYLNAGYTRTAEAVVEAFGPEIEQALEHPVDFKSALQELLARRGEEVAYTVTSEEGPPHERTYTVAARLEGRELGSGRGRSKKHAEQEAAREAVERLEG